MLFVYKYMPHGKNAGDQNLKAFVYETVTSGIGLQKLLKLLKKSRGEFLALKKK